MRKLELGKVIYADIRTEPAAASVTLFVNGREKSIFKTFRLCHIFGISVLCKQRNLPYFAFLVKSCQAFRLISGNADILHYLSIIELLVVLVDGVSLALSVDYALPTDREAVNLSFMPPPPTAERKKWT